MLTVSMLSGYFLYYINNLYLVKHSKYSIILINEEKMFLVILESTTMVVAILVLIVVYLSILSGILDSFRKFLAKRRYIKMGKQKCDKCKTGFATSLENGVLYCDRCKSKPDCACGCDGQPDAFNVPAALKAINGQSVEKKSLWRRLNAWFIRGYTNQSGPHI